MIGGQIKLGVLHIDDIPVLEEQMGKPVAVLASFRDVKPLSHYNLIVVKRERLKQRRDAYVRALAAIVEAARFIYDPRNAARVAQIADCRPRPGVPRQEPGGQPRPRLGVDAALDYRCADPVQPRGQADHERQRRERE